MSLKGVELQIALPRTTEVTQVQNQLNQKPSNDQAALAFREMQKAAEERAKSPQVGESLFRGVKDEERAGSSRREFSRDAAKRRKGEEEPPLAAGKESEMNHPYKGKHIDITL